MSRAAPFLLGALLGLVGFIAAFPTQAGWMTIMVLVWLAGWGAS